MTEFYPNVHSFGYEAQPQSVQTVFQQMDPSVVAAPVTQYVSAPAPYIPATVYPQMAGPLICVPPPIVQTSALVPYIPPITLPKPLSADDFGPLPAAPPAPKTVDCGEVDRYGYRKRLFTPIAKGAQGFGRTQAGKRTVTNGHFEPQKGALYGSFDKSTRQKDRFI